MAAFFFVGADRGLAYHSVSLLNATPERHQAGAPAAQTAAARQEKYAKRCWQKNGALAI